MKSRLIALTMAAFVGQVAVSEAATLWKGIVVVTSRTNIAACINEYSVGESFEILYRPNFGLPVNETIQVLGPNGSFLVTSSDTTDKTLRTGNVTVSGASYAIGFSVSNVNNPISITPASIIATTPAISMTGTIKNAGVTGCNVTFKASLLPIADGPL